MPENGDHERRQFDMPLDRFDTIVAKLLILSVSLAIADKLGEVNPLLGGGVAAGLGYIAWNGVNRFAEKHIKPQNDGK